VSIGTNLLIIILALLDSATLIAFSQYAPYPAKVPLGDPSAYRNLYVHVPAAISLILIASTAALAIGVLGLRRRDDRLIKLLDRAIGIIIVVGAYTWISGTIWSAESWGSPFTWDARQLTILVMVLAYSAYPLIRRSEDPERSVMLAYAYAVAAYSTTVISLVAPRLVESLHPEPGTVAELSIDMRMLVLLRVALVASVLIYVILRGGARIAAIVYLAFTPLLIPGLLPWVLYHPIRVVGAGHGYVILDDGSRAAWNWEELFNNPYIGGDPVIVDRFVVVDDGSIVGVVTHFSVPVNALLYLLTQVILHLVVSRLR